MINAAFTHAGLTTKYRKYLLVKKDFLAVKLVQYLVCKKDRKLSYCKQEIWNLKLGERFHIHKVSFMVVKTIKCKRGIK